MLVVRLKRLAADGLKRQVQLLHSARMRNLSPENWSFGVINGVFSWLWGYLGGVLGSFGVTKPNFYVFSRQATAPALALEF